MCQPYLLLTRMQLTQPHGGEPRRAVKKLRSVCGMLANPIVLLLCGALSILVMFGHKAFAAPVRGHSAHVAGCCQRLYGRVVYGC
jgi:hypothetical protein